MNMTREQFFKSQRISSAAKVLRLLKEKKIVTNKELNTVAFRYGARIHDLRAEGHVIVTNRITDTLWEYWYHGLKTEKEWDSGD